MSGYPNAFQNYQQTLVSTLERFECFFQSQVESFEPELKEVIAAVLRHPGKRLRPGFVFACAGMIVKNEALRLHVPPREITPQGLRLASIVEFIHLASLIHDDILDNATSRHGEKTHHLIFNPQISVLTGDTLFLRANELAAVEDDLWLGRAVATAAKATCSGEIAQGLYRKDILNLKDYERQLSLKTGKLFGLSCALGGYLAAMNENDRHRLASYGESFGVAYQLYDDAVDIWGDEREYKKTLGTDQTQHKWTLPWILLEEELGEVALEDLWHDRSAARAAFEKYEIFGKATRFFEVFIDRAQANLKGLPQEALLVLPLAYVSQKWQGLCAEGAGCKAVRG